MSTLYRLDDCDPPYELVSTPPVGERHVPKEFRDRIAVHTVHDGDCIPRRFVQLDDGTPRIDPTLLERRYVEERDWGANLVASEIAAAMGLPGYARCRLARVVLDFNRFPGSTPHDDAFRPLERLAINNPFSSELTHGEKTELLERYYDRISAQLERELVRDKLVMIAVHTYDEHNATMTRRPHLSLLSQVKGYREESRMPYGYFDPMYPDVLGESTCSRILRDRVSLSLERHGFRVSHNYPYALPAGCLEVRSQVWLFFDYLRQRFEQAHPETREESHYQLVWTMLLNTNLRLQEGEMLRSFLHRFRKPLAEHVDQLRASHHAYDHIKAFLEKSDVEEGFRRSKNRPSSLGVEIRKDLVCSFDKNGRPLPLTDAQRNAARLIGGVFADAIRTFLEEDRSYL